MNRRDLLKAAIALPFLSSVLSGGLASAWAGTAAALRSRVRPGHPAWLFFVHHGVGSEAWSADGFTRVSG